MTQLSFFTSSLLATPHACFDRLGGCSAFPFDSLNLSYGVGDDPALVKENRHRVCRAFGLTGLQSVRQTHGDRVFFVDSLQAPEPEGYDALITNKPGLALLIQQADCQAVLLHDPVQQVVAAVHCGWRGSVLNIIATAIRALQERYQVRPVNLRALVSPSLGPCCGEFIHYQRELPAWMQAFQVRPCYFDFWAISRHQLHEAGILPEHIVVAEICTRCNADYFSYRRACQESAGMCGRNGSLIMLV